VRVSTGELSEKIFKRLTQLYLQNKDVEQSPSKRQDNPLVIILDRRTDLHTMLYHSWTYLNLIQDIFKIQNNQYQYLEDAKA
jgi:fumarate reductase subunit C